MDKLYIVIPAYNEAANIEAVVEQWHPIVEKIGNGSRLVIFDDGSKDKTFSILKSLSLSGKYPYLESVTKTNSGHGATLLVGYRYAINNEADYIFQTDSDGQTVSGEFWSFWERRNGYDFIIGARDARGDGISRIFVTKVLKIVIWFIFGTWISDVNTPFRIMNAEKLKPILADIPKDFFLSNVLMSVLVVLRKQRYIWLPITFKPRQGGINSINLRRIFKIGVKAVRDFQSVKMTLRGKDSF